MEEDNLQYIAYHYCSADTFINIMQSKVLWLCNLTESNDEDELRITYSTIWDSVKEGLKSTDLNKDDLSDVIKIIDNQCKIQISVDPPFGICFCRQEDLLSQWKEYGDETKGLSLGFDLNWFIRHGIKQQKPMTSFIQSNAIGIDNVIYSSDQFVQDMTEAIYKAIKIDGKASWITRITPTLKHYSGFIKNSSFKAEDEIRIVYYPVASSMDFKVKDVSGISGLKTNVKDRYEIPWTDDSSQALRSICIGHNCPLSETDILEILRKNNLDTGINITKSTIPYRVKG